MTITLSFTAAHVPRVRRLAPWLAVLALLAQGVAQADDHARGPAFTPTYTRECGSCHVAFAPALLPAASWQRVMAQLPQHYGVDASMGAAEQKQIAQWLQAHAGTGKRVAQAAPEDRITRSPWWLREHREVAADTWKRAAIKSPSNCAACHAQADSGSYREQDIRIPR